MGVNTSSINSTRFGRREGGMLSVGTAGIHGRIYENNKCLRMMDDKITIEII